MDWVSTAVAPPFTIGYRTPVYSRQRVATRISLRFYETVIQANSERYWLYAAVDPETTHLLHVRLFLDQNPRTDQDVLRRTM